MEDTKTEESATEEASKGENAKEDAEKTDASAKEKKSSKLPLAVGGGVGVVAVAGGILAFLKKRRAK